MLDELETAPAVGRKRLNLLETFFGAEVQDSTGRDGGIVGVGGFDVAPEFWRLDPINREAVCPLDVLCHVGIVA